MQVFRPLIAFRTNIVPRTTSSLRVPHTVFPVLSSVRMASIQPNGVDSTTISTNTDPLSTGLNAVNNESGSRLRYADVGSRFEVLVNPYHVY